jgi:hypothetical protein
MGAGAKMKIVLKHKNVKQSDFAVANEESLANINMVFNEKRSPSYQLLLKFIEQFPDVDLNWLFNDSIADDIETLNLNYVPGKMTLRLSKEFTDIENKLARIKDLLTQ